MTLEYFWIIFVTAILESELYRLYPLYLFINNIVKQTRENSDFKTLLFGL